jgi:hypothetical protein
MKMVKSLLLASAAGLAATAGAQAADMPVKAKPVEYVKVCSLYGAGFFYIPGTDTCIRIGGQIRAEYNVGDSNNNAFTGSYAPGDGQATNTRDRNIYNFRTRAYIYHDTRTQTSYGTLRTYTHVRMEVTTPNGTAASATTPVLESAIIQWGGFTAGRSQSSFNHSPWKYAFAYNAIATPGLLDQPVGRNVIAYTHQFGNGVSGTIALEDPKNTTKRSIYNGALALDATFANPLTTAGNVNGGNTYPDVVAALRIDQAWGGFWVAGTLTNNHVAYNCGQPTGACTDISSGQPPSDKAAGAVSAALKINVPTGTGDAVYIQGGYGVGATSYVINGSNGNGFGVYRDRGFAGTNGTLAFGYIFDAVYDTRVGGTNSLQQTTAYGGNIGYEHNWNPNWRTSIFGGAQYVDYNATANAIICSKFVAAGPGTLALGGRACNMDSRIVQAGTRTVWEPVKDLTFGLEFIYANVSGKMNGATFTQTNNNLGKAAGAYRLSDQDVFSGTLSIRRFF